MKQTIIYLRTSTEEQLPELQQRDCEALALKLDLKDFEIIPEQQSAFKDVEREKFEKIREAIKKGEVKILICWDLDRLFRNRRKLIEFFEFCKIYGCKIYSARQDWLESLNKIQEPFNEIMFNLMLQIMGWLAEEESSKKSMRVKNAVRKEDGKPTISYKGNKWGFHSLPEETNNKIIELHKQGKPLRQICKEVFYWDNSRNKKNVSLGYVHKLISKINQEQASFKASS